MDASIDIPEISQLAPDSCAIEHETHKMLREFGPQNVTDPFFETEFKDI